MQWWQLAIPAGSSLAGAWVGALLQARNGLNQLKEQNREADRVRAEQAEESAQVRSEERAQTLELRIIDEKRTAYASFMRLSDEIVDAAAKRDRAQERWDRLEPLAPEERPFDEWKEAIEDLQTDTQNLVDLSERLLDVAYTIYFLAPSEINAIVYQWTEERRTGADKTKLGKLARKFRAAARKDLGIQDPEPSAASRG
ncbi:hypothetical protein [Streptomyces sp. NPDC057257]|uniref:hypothetical protein n=1 Tax=Streptomyces sp. NPDC057257 TaxID=3346071 RepID=UPI003630971E